MLQNDLLLRTLRGEQVERPPRMDDAPGGPVFTRVHGFA